MTATTAGTLTYAIDSAHSRAHFAIRHLAIAHVRGEFSLVSGTVDYDAADLSSLSVNATIDANSFQSGNVQRDEHVKGDHFLDVAQYPTVTFASKSATATGDGKAQVVGDLTLHGVAKEVALNIEETSHEITDPWGNRRLGVSATTHIKRSDFGIDFNAPMEGGGFMLSDEVAVTLDLQLVRKPA
jgi:polyisoprenoid-binding protein YceI